MSATPLLSVQDLEAGYGSLPILTHVDLHVQRGESVAVLGANGAGKTTLIRAITGFADVYAGTIRLGDRTLNRLAPFEIVRAGVAQVPDGRRLFRSLTVDENLEVATYARRRELDSLHRDALRREVYDLFPRLEERRTQIARTLSGGEQQMLAIARALVLEPRVLLLDEPSTGLAPLLVDLIFDAMGQLTRGRDMALLLVEQNTQAALELCKRSYLLRGGKVVAEGTADELRSRGLVQAAYLGSASTAPARAVLEECTASADSEYTTSERRLNHGEFR